MKLGWGIAGCGWVARDFAAPAMMKSSNGRLVAAYDTDPSAVAAVALGDVMGHRFLDAFLGSPGLDAVYVATPNHAHRPLVEAAARAGLAVLCEKPMAPTQSDAVAMVRACEAAGVPYATAFDQRFHPAHVHLVRMIAEGAVGTVTAIRIVYACWLDDRWSADNWRVDPARAGGGALIDLAPHGLDLAAMLLGEALHDVHAFGQGRVHGYAQRGAVEDAAMLTALSASGALVQLHVAYNCPETLPRRRMEIVGTEGMLTAMDTMGQTPGGSVTLTRASDGSAEVVEIPGADRSPFLNQLEAFADCVLAGRRFPFTPAHDLAIMALVERAQAMVRPALARAS